MSTTSEPKFKVGDKVTFLSREEGCEVIGGPFASIGGWLYVIKTKAYPVLITEKSLELDTPPDKPHCANIDERTVTLERVLERAVSETPDDLDAVKDDISDLQKDLMFLSDDVDVLDEEVYGNTTDILRLHTATQVLRDDVNNLTNALTNVVRSINKRFLD
jgi:hypothetical protein